MPNKITAEIKVIAQEHGADAITELARIMKTSESDQARVAAIKELLDRGYGKATQYEDATVKVSVEHTNARDEIARRIAGIAARLETDGDYPSPDGTAVH